MKTAILRWVHDDYVSGAMPCQVVEDSEDRVVLFQAGGSSQLKAVGTRGGPRDRNLPPGSPISYETVPWTGDGVVRAHRRGDPWSVWRWLSIDGAWSDYVYVNLEYPWVPTPIGYDSRDLILDLIITGDGRVVRKHEDELEWAVSVGKISESDRADVLEMAESALAAYRAGAWPFSADQVTITPPPTARTGLRGPLIIGGAVLFVLIAVAIVATLLLARLFGTQRGPTQTVNEFIRSIEAGDCALYVAVTTEEFRNGTVAADECETSGVFDGSGTIDYVLDITGSRLTGDTATVEAILTIVDNSTPDVDPTVTPITFGLVQESDVWKVDVSY